MKERRCEEREADELRRKKKRRCETEFKPMISRLEEKQLLLKDVKKSTFKRMPAKQRKQTIFKSGKIEERFNPSAQLSTPSSQTSQLLPSQTQQLITLPFPKQNHISTSLHPTPVFPVIIKLYRSKQHFRAIHRDLARNVGSADVLGGTTSSWDD